MANRIEPFRDYSEHEVVNLFALDLTSNKHSNADGTTDVTTTLADMKNLSSVQGCWDSGVVVEVSAGGLPQEVPGDWAGDMAANPDLRAYLGHAHTDAHIGWNNMPMNSLTVKPSESDKAIGITLRQTLAYDENGENLLRYPVKKDELQAVGPGETVPVLSRGLVLLSKDAFVDMKAAPAKGQRIKVALTAAAGVDPGANGLAKYNIGKLVVEDGVTKNGKAGATVDDKEVDNNSKFVGQVLAVDSTLGKYLCKLSF